MNFKLVVYCCSVAKLCPTLCDPRGLQHSRLPCPSLSLRVSSDTCPLNGWCYLAISSSVTPFPTFLQSFPASRSFLMSGFFLFSSGGQNIGISASASVLPVNSQGWFPIGLTGLISLLSKGLSRVFFSTTIWKHEFLATHSNILAWKIPWTEEPGGLQTMGWQSRTWLKDFPFPFSLPYGPTLTSAHDYWKKLHKNNKY